MKTQLPKSGEIGCGLFANRSTISTSNYADSCQRGSKVPIRVNLDALIPREDFAVVTEQDDAPTPSEITVRALESRDFFYRALRKPDFQRETGEWGSQRVSGLVQSFVGGDLIPAVILWRNRELLFVIDGSHRLSALISWVHDDYGDGPLSMKFFNNMIPEEQVKVASRTRQLIEKEIGSYQSHVQAAANPDGFGPDVVRRARKMGSLVLNLQWVHGDPKKAEDAFIRINQQAAAISPQELELLKNRQKPNAISSRAIIRRGTGHKYWSSFSQETQDQIEATAAGIHKLLFEPPMQYPIKSADIPAGGPVYSGTALRMVYDFVNTCTGTPSPQDDETGIRTVECLSRCQRVMNLLLSTKPNSLGLHPAVYFYSWTGKQQPILFLVVSGMIIEFEREKKLNKFTEARKAFEEFLVSNRPLLNQLIRKYGTKQSGEKQLRMFYDVALTSIAEHKDADEITKSLMVSFPFLQPTELPYSGKSGAKISTSVKSGVVMQEFLNGSPRCAICGGYIPSQAITIDHKERRQDGGTSGAENAQLAHPYCNTGYKESQHSKSTL